VHDAGAPLAGRFDRRGRELWDGAHNPAATAWLRAQLGDERFDVVVASILRDKDAAAMLADLAKLAPALIATQASNARALGATELADLGIAHFDHVTAEPDPVRALGQARESTRGGILVTGSLYLLADLARNA
jgi:folylpolyglutamate synthase/dihydropteroate synthase